MNSVTGCAELPAGLPPMEAGCHCCAPTRNAAGSAVPSTRLKVPSPDGGATVASDFPVSVVRTVMEKGCAVAGFPVAVSAT
jgi:hypothetical protein